MASTGPAELLVFLYPNHIKDYVWKPCFYWVIESSKHEKFSDKLRISFPPVFKLWSADPFEDSTLIVEGDNPEEKLVKRWAAKFKSKSLWKRFGGCNKTMQILSTPSKHLKIFALLLLLLVFLENIELLCAVVESHLKHFVSVSVRDLHWARKKRMVGRGGGAEYRVAWNSILKLWNSNIVLHRYQTSINHQLKV